MPQSLQQSQGQSQILAPQMRQGLVLLQMTAPELQAELQRQMEMNPLIESVSSPLEKTLSAELPQEHDSGAISEQTLDFTPDGAAARKMLGADDADRDTFLENMENFQGGAENGTVDPDAVSRRQSAFDRLVKSETLHEHLYRQIRTSTIPAEDWDLADILIEYIDDDGYFKGSIPDIMMVHRATEPRILATLRRISQLDPLGCGGRNLRECLLFQMEKLDDSPWEKEVRAVIDRHLTDIAARREDRICADVGIERKDYPLVLAELRTLNPKPGHGFTPREGEPIAVRPEVFVTKGKSGHWVTHVTERDVPEIRISPKYVAMLKDPHCSAEAKAYIRERLAAAESLIDSLAERQETIRKITQEIVDAQRDVFNQKSMAALRPLTQQQIADRVGVHNATVSRTVRDKYISTPFGTFGLNRFFATGLKAEDGLAVSSASVQNLVREIIASEDKSRPLSDEAISKRLKESGITCARRTVAKYRVELGIPGTSARKSAT